MKQSLLFLVLIFTTTLFSQNDKDGLKVGERYLEDQLYISITYNSLLRQPKEATSSGFSYGASAGYIRDIPFNRRGRWAIGVGVGYNYDSFNHGLRVDEKGNLTIPNQIAANKIRLHDIEFPIQLRWRTSTAVTYSFWRIYAGVRLNYNFSNTFSYKYNNQIFSYTNIDSYNNFQAGLELAAGYRAFNFYIYYGLTPMYKNILMNNQKVNTRIAKFGLVFYLL